MVKISAFDPKITRDFYQYKAAEIISINILHNYMIVFVISKQKTTFIDVL